MSASRILSRATAAVGALTLLTTLAACSSDDGQTSVSEKPVSGGSLTYLVDQTQLTLDPGVSPAEVTGLIDRNIFDSLVVQSGPTTFEPWLAEKWDVSADGLTYTFDLKQGVKFSDGVAFDASAVKATLDHIVDPKSKSQFAASFIAPYKSSTVVDDSTIKIELSRPFRPFLQALSTPYLGIQSPQALEAPTSEYKPVGTGPFTFVSWTQQKDVTLQRNPDYNSPPANAAHAGAAYIDTLKFNYVAEDATRYGALTSGQAQAIGGVPPRRVDSLTSDDKLQVLRGPSPGINYSLFFNVKSPLTSDPLVRRAVQAAVDIPALVASVYSGEFAAAKNVLDPSTPDFDKEAAASLQTYDVAEAGRLLDQAGWTGRNKDGYRTKDGAELKLSWPYLALINREQRDVLGQAIQAEAKKAGIRIDRPNLDVGEYTERVFGGDYDILDTSNARADADVLRFSFSTESTLAKGGANVSLVSSPELDSWLDEASRTSDLQVAKEDYAKVQSYVLENALALPGYSAPYLLGAAANLRGVTFDVQGNARLYDAWLAR